MMTGFRGTFVISWTQVELDGLTAEPVRTLAVGASWLWRGEAVRVDTDLSGVDGGRDRGCRHRLDHTTGRAT